VSRLDFSGGEGAVIGAVVQAIGEGLAIRREFLATGVGEHVEKLGSAQQGLFVTGKHGGDFPGGPLASSVLVQTLAGVLADPRVRPRLWIDWGLVRTGGSHNESIEAAATERGIEMVALLTDTYGYQADELHWFEDPIGEHDENSWARRFPDVMTALFAEP